MINFNKIIVVLEVAHVVKEATFSHEKNLNVTLFRLIFSPFPSLRKPCQKKLENS